MQSTELGALRLACVKTGQVAVLTEHVFSITINNTARTVEAAYAEISIERKAIASISGFQPD